MYTSTLSLTSALDVDTWSAPRSGNLNPGKELVSIVNETEWAPGLF